VDGRKRDGRRQTDCGRGLLMIDVRLMHDGGAREHRCTLCSVQGDGPKYLQGWVCG
jgi:hypothetical protein